MVVARVWGESPFSSSTGTSGAGLVSETLPFEEDFLNSFDIGIGLGTKGRRCQSRKVEDIQDILGR